ncbi:MAG: aminoacyl-tRNA hydrolase [Ignavibacteriales bacterium]|nr:aminoacyl-tRNA hydrolase [Ignavibacteriales bacterium]
MFFVIGLGNPEGRYSGTRHNIGFEVADRIARRLRCSFKEGRGEYLIARGEAGETPLAIVKPQTYMNQSGLAVMEIQEEFGVTPEQFLVVCDDFQIPLGQLRLRLRGSDGGHNGLSSIIYHLQSEEFPRLRCGIASSSMPKEKDLLAEFVLEQFTAVERPVIDTMVDDAAQACLLAVTEGMARSMNEFNKKQSSEQDPTHNP